MPSVRKLPDGRFQAQYRVVPNGRRYTRTTALKRDAERWLSRELAKVERGDWTDPVTARMTVGEWCDTWLAGYATRRPSTIRQAEIHIRQIKMQFGDMRLAAVRPSHVKAWTAKLRDDGYEVSYVSHLHSRLAQLFGDAVHDGIVARSPCSRRTSPPTPQQRPFVASTAAVWALYGAFPEHLRAAILLGAFAGLRSGEVCGLRVPEDVDFLRGIVKPTVQYPAEPLKTEASRWPVPIPLSMAEMLAAHVAAHPCRDGTLLANAWGRQLAPWALDRTMRDTRGEVEGLPEAFRFHDLRHYYASALIADGADVKVVQHRVRHKSASTTLNTYSHLWPDRDESTRETVDRLISERSTGERLANGGGAE